MSTVKGNDLWPGAAWVPKNDPSSLSAASGQVGNESPATPVAWWLALVGLVVAARVVYEFAPAAARVG